MRTFLFFLLSIFSLNIFAQDRPLIMTWDTEQEGFTCAKCIMIPFVMNGHTYNIDWENDGTYEELGVTGVATHEYDNPGVYTVAVMADSLAINFTIDIPRQDFNKLLSIDQWGDVHWVGLEFGFYNCKNLEIKAIDIPDLSGVRSLFNMFAKTDNLKGDLSMWDVSRVKSFTAMFEDATSFTSDLSSWDMSSATDLGNMFKGAKFFDSDISKWDVSKVTRMSGMFEEVIAFNADLSQWDVSGVNAISSMFEGATSFNQDLSQWDVSGVANFSDMFKDATSFDANLRDWEVSEAVNMSSMFENATSFSSDVKKWNVSQVSDFESMFEGATSFNADLSGWSLENAVDIESMLDNCGMDPRNYDRTLDGWGRNPSIPEDLILGSLNLEYCDETGRDLLKDKGWNIIGDSKAEDADCLSSVEDISIQERPYIYPVPAQEQIHIANLVVETRYRIYNRIGMQLREGSCHSQEPIAVEILHKGLYFLVLELDTGTQILRFVKI